MQELGAMLRSSVFSGEVGNFLYNTIELGLFYSLEVVTKPRARIELMDFTMFNDLLPVLVLIKKLQKFVKIKLEWQQCQMSGEALFSRL